MKNGSNCLITICFVLSSQISTLIAQPSFTLNGSTIVMSENCYRLTSHKSSNDVGSLWCEFPIELTHAIDFRFAVNLGCSKYAGEGMWYAIPVAAIIGIPLYIRAEAVIPLSAALVQKGMALGSVMALIIGSAGASLTEVILLKSIFKNEMIAGVKLPFVIGFQ